MKFMQNSFGKTTMKIGKIIVPCKVVTTTKIVQIWYGDKIIASAGVKNAKDFDYDSLLKIAKHKSTIEVA